jgi:hypothetical protein
MASICMRQMFAKDHLLPGPALAYVHGIAARVQKQSGS